LAHVAYREERMPITADEFRLALGHFASTVTVVTTELESGQPAGLTVTAFSSLSLKPPLVLVCLDHSAKLHDRLPKGSYFAVNMLDESQEVLSRRFASSRTDPFKDIEFDRSAHGCPLLRDVVATLECRVVDRLPGGDHTIVVGKVEAANVHDRKPLLYFRGGYTRLQ